MKSDLLKSLEALRRLHKQDIKYTQLEMLLAKTIEVTKDLIKQENCTHQPKTEKSWGYYGEWEYTYCSKCKKVL